MRPIYCLDGLPVWQYEWKLAGNIIDQGLWDSLKIREFLGDKWAKRDSMIV